MTGLLLGILSALVWGVAGVTGSLASRRIGATSAIAWSMLLSLAAAVPLALLSGMPGRTDARTLLWILLIAACMLGGLVCVYAGVRYGSISVVAPVSATYGGVAALISIVGGEPVTVIAVGSLALAVVGAILASMGESAQPGSHYANQRAAALLAAGAAVLWGIQLWAGGQVQDDIGASWVVGGSRFIAVLVISLPLLALRRVVTERKAIIFAFVAGVGEVAGFTLYLMSSAYGVAEAAVLTGQYGTVAALIGVAILKERLRGIQYIGLAVIVIAIIGLSVN